MIKQVQIIFYEDRVLKSDVPIYDTYMYAFPPFKEKQIINLKIAVQDKTKWDVEEINQMYRIIKIEYGFEKTYTSSSIVEVSHNEIMFVTVEKYTEEHEWR